MGGGGGWSRKQFLAADVEERVDGAGVGEQEHKTGPSRPPRRSGPAGPTGNETKRAPSRTRSHCQTSRPLAGRDGPREGRRPDPPCGGPPEFGAECRGPTITPPPCSRHARKAERQDRGVHRSGHPRAVARIARPRPRARRACSRRRTRVLGALVAPRYADRAQVSVMPLPDPPVSRTGHHQHRMLVLKEAVTKVRAWLPAKKQKWRSNHPLFSASDRGKTQGFAAREPSRPRFFFSDLAVPVRLVAGPETSCKAKLDSAECI